MPPAGIDAPMDNGAPPMTQSGSGSGDVNFFSQDLGTILRLKYSTESYGQDGTGNFDIGTFQVMTMDDTSAFFDGQVTMNEADGVGFNIGLGYRWMNYPGYAGDLGRMDGISVWADGTHTDAGNFFPQVGVSWESLGELWEMRANGYIPVGQREQVGAFKPTGETGFTGNSLANLTQATVDRSFYAADLEFARRLGAERDAWAFAGPYFVGNDTDDSGGFRVGVRGYAYPDLLLQMAFSHDEVFNTNATFSLVWFVGRTRTSYQPSCTPADNMRAPVLRNDYVVLSHTKRQGMGTALTQTNGDALRFVHVDSNAPAGGNGTAEAPFDMLTDANGTGSQNGDVILVHSTSVFNNEPSIVLKDNQRLLGEGNNLMLTVATQQKGTITIPESSPGARALARPIINIPANTDAVVLADNNELANFDMNGQNLPGNRAIAAPAGGAGNPNLHDLAISNTGSSGISFTPASIIDTNDLNNNGSTTDTIVRGNVTINNVTLNNVTGNGVTIDSATTTDLTLPTVSLQEAIAISNVTSTGGAGNAINIENTHSSTVAANRTTLTNFTYDGQSVSSGAIRLNNFDSTFNASTSTLSNVSPTGNGVKIAGDTDGTINFASTVNMTNLHGPSVDINGNVAGTDQLNGRITFANALATDTGSSVAVQNIGTGAVVAFNGNVTDTGTGLFINSNSGGSIGFGGNVTATIDTPGATAINMTNNTGATIDFIQDVVINSTSTANGFVATGGGTLTAPNTTNSISTETGQPLKITGMTIGTVGVAFADVNRTAAGTTNAIQIENNTGGPITIGNTTDLVGDAGTVASGTANAVSIKNTANVSITGLRVNNTSAVSGVRVENSGTTTSTVNLSDMEINGGTIGVETVGGGTGALNMTVNDTNINSSLTTGMSFNDVDHGTTNVTNTTIDGNNANAAAKGVLITGSNATINFNGTSAVREFSSTDFEVNGGAGTISYAGSIVNSSATNAGDTTGKSVHIHDVTGGSVQFTSTSTINDDNDGMLVQNNGGAAAISFLGTNTFNTTGDAVTVDNNDVGGTNATITFAKLAITTTGIGRGFVATNGGTLSITGTTNTINSDNGAGLTITDMTIGSVDFANVTVDGTTGPANAIILQNLTGGQVTIGTTAGAAGSGGMLKSTGDAILLTNAQNVDFNHVEITTAGGNGVTANQTSADTALMDITFNDLRVDAATGSGLASNSNDDSGFNLRLENSTLAKNVVLVSSGSGHYGLLVDNTDVSSTGTTDAFSLALTGTISGGDIVFRNGNNFTAVDANALSINANGTNANTVKLLVENSNFTNNSNTSNTVQILNDGGTVMLATVQGNVLVNNGTADPFDMESTGATANVTLKLGGTTAAEKNTANGGAGTFTLKNNGSTFVVVDRDQTFPPNNARNNGPVNPQPNAGAFGTTTTAPMLPTVP